METANNSRNVALDIQARPAPFPARVKQAAADIAGVPTDITTFSFSDKILITISQDGRLAHWVHVPLESSNPTLADRRIQLSDDDTDLLPLPHLTATTVLGGGDSARDTLGQLFATQIASAIVSRKPEESRLLVLGFGLRSREVDTDTFVEVFDLAMTCLG